METIELFGLTVTKKQAKRVLKELNEDGLSEIQCECSQKCSWWVKLKSSEIRLSKLKRFIDAK